MIFSFESILLHISKIVSLKRGDLIFTGTPEGVSKVGPGDEIKIEIETIGTLINTIK